ncbi:MAG: ribosome small subunit-dependent GTPase A [Spirochaetia bacterium]|nr:ribosome small subunit-dependent GTPase A [Spirochaetia bacterium]
MNFSAKIVGIFGAYFWVRVENSDTTLRAKPRGKLRLGARKESKFAELKAQHMLAIGDHVVIQKPDKADEKGIEAYITELKPRKNIFQRASFSRLQTLGANLDAVVIITSVEEPSFNPGFVDRVLVETENENLRAVLILNKTDLMQKKTSAELSEKYNKILRFCEEYENLGYAVFYETFKKEIISEKLMSFLTENLYILNGLSGVGKSTFLNLLAEEKIQVTGDIGTSAKGKHTTTNPVLYKLKNGVEVIDVPGIREFGLAHKTPREIGGGFIEFRKYNCRYDNCIHLKEPGCGVKEAVIAGKIKEFRYNSYLSILESLGEEYKPRKGDFRKQ